MEFSDKDIVTWHVFFTRSKYYKGIMRFLKRDYSHVMAARLSEGGELWMIINPLFSYLQCRIEVVSQYPNPRMLCDSDAVMLTVEAHIEPDNTMRVGLFSCVEVVKSLIGVNKWWIITPYQLYKYLRGEHGR